MSRRVAGALAVLTLAFSAACTGLPTSGPVITGAALNQPERPALRIVPAGPVFNASAEETVRGFLRAGADSDPARAIGRSFLAPMSVDRWRIGSEPITVYPTDDSLKVTPTSATTVKVTATATAQIDPSGRLVELPAGSVAQTSFTVTKVAGQWRVELPPEGFGLWLDADSFERLYAPERVFFVTPTERHLVADTLWFANNSGLLTAIANAQLEPVPGHLLGAVNTGVPAGTSLDVSAVPTQNGTAQIDLTAVAQQADPDQRRVMWAQFAAALTRTPNADAVTLTVLDAPFDIPGEQARLASPEALGYGVQNWPTTTTVLVRNRERLSRIDPRFIGDGAVRPEARSTPTDSGALPDPASISVGWQRLAMSPAGEVGAVSGDRKQLGRWDGNTYYAVPLTATNLVRPSYDGRGYLWSAGRDLGGQTRVWAMAAEPNSPTRAPSTVSASWLAGRQVVALRLSPEGSRVAVISTDAKGNAPRLDIAGIMREANGRPHGLTEPLRQAFGLTLMRDVTWLDDNTLSVIGRISTKQPLRVYSVTIGEGLSQWLRGPQAADDAASAPVPGAVAITTWGGERGVLVVTDDNRILARAGTGWRQLDVGSDVVVAGN